MADHLLEETLTVEQANELRDYHALPVSHIGLSAALPRPDLDPRLAALLHINATRGLARDEVASLLSGRSTNCRPIAGKAQVRTGPSLAEILGLEAGEIPVAPALENILSGRRGDGRMLIERTTGLARAKLFSAYGLPQSRLPLPVEFKHMLDGCRADGGPLRASVVRDALGTRRQSVAYIDLTLSADKSVSVAWALARTAVERAAMVAAHRDAVRFTLRYVEEQIGRARRGNGGRDGYDPGVIAWISFDHVTARATQGRSSSGDLVGQVAGDPQLHTHTVIPNVVMTESGRVGGLDLARLSGRVHVFGAVYHAKLAAELRSLGAVVELDRTTGAALLSGVPNLVRDAFSKRTKDGVSAAQVYARAQGLDWNDLTKARRVALAKQAVQGSPGQVRTDDRSDTDAWRKQATALDWEHLRVLDPGRPMVRMPYQARLDTACAVALELLDHDARRSVPTAATIELAAARGLVAAGVETIGDVAAVTRHLAAGDHRLDCRGDAMRFVVVPASRGGEEVQVIVGKDSSATDEAQIQAKENSIAASWRQHSVSDLPALTHGLKGWITRESQDVPLVVQAPSIWSLEAGMTQADMAAGRNILIAAGCSMMGLNQSARRFLHTQGQLGSDLLTLPATNGQGEPYELAIAAGDCVRLVGRANAAYADGGRGVIGAAGSVLEVVDADDEGITLRSLKGREGRVRWSTLRGPDGRVRIDYAYTRPMGLGPTALPAPVIVFPEGTQGLDPDLLPPMAVLGRAFLLTSEAAEVEAFRRHTGRPVSVPITQDELWTQIATNLLVPAQPLTVRNLLARACEAQRSAARTLQRTTAWFAQRAAKGLSPAPALSALRERQAARTLESDASLAPAHIRQGTPSSATTDIGMQPALKSAVSTLNDALGAMQLMVRPLTQVILRRRASPEAGPALQEQPPSVSEAEKKATKLAASAEREKERSEKKLVKAAKAAEAAATKAARQELRLTVEANRQSVIVARKTDLAHREKIFTALVEAGEDVRAAGALSGWALADFTVGMGPNPAAVYVTEATVPRTIAEAVARPAAMAAWLASEAQKLAENTENWNRAKAYREQMLALQAEPVAHPEIIHAHAPVQDPVRIDQVWLEAVGIPDVISASHQKPLGEQARSAGGAASPPIAEPEITASVEAKKAVNEAQEIKGQVAKSPRRSKIRGRGGPGMGG